MGAARDGDIVTQSEGICEDVGVLVTTRDEKTAPPKKARLQKRHCIFYQKRKCIFYQLSMIDEGGDGDDECGEGDVVAVQQGQHALE